MQYASTVRDYGSLVVAAGSGSVIREVRALPALEADRQSGQLVLRGSGLEPGQVCYLGASLRSHYVALEAFGHAGTSVLDLDRSQSALLDVVPADAQGRWARGYPLSPAIANLLEYQVFLFQFYCLDQAGRMWASSADVVRF